MVSFLRSLIDESIFPSLLLSYLLAKMILIRAYLFFGQASEIGITQLVSQPTSCIRTWDSGVLYLNNPIDSFVPKFITNKLKYKIQHMHTHIHTNYTITTHSKETL